MLAKDFEGARHLLAYPLTVIYHFIHYLPVNIVCAQSGGLEIENREGANLCLTFDRRFLWKRRRAD